MFTGPLVCSRHCPKRFTGPDSSNSHCYGMVFSSFVCWFICLWNEKPEAQRRDLTHPRSQSMCESQGSELWSPVLGLLLLAGRWLPKKHTHQSWGKASTEILKAFKNPAAWNLIEVMGGENSIWLPTQGTQESREQMKNIPIGVSAMRARAPNKHGFALGTTLLPQVGWLSTRSAPPPRTLFSQKDSPISVISQVCLSSRTRPARNWHSSLHQGTRGQPDGRPTPSQNPAGGSHIRGKIYSH